MQDVASGELLARPKPKLSFLFRCNWGPDSWQLTRSNQLASLPSSSMLAGKPMLKSALYVNVIFEPCPGPGLIRVFFSRGLLFVLILSGLQIRGFTKKMVHHLMFSIFSLHPLPCSRKEAKQCLSAEKHTMQDFYNIGESLNWSSCWIQKVNKKVILQWLPRLNVMALHVKKEKTNLRDL